MNGITRTSVSVAVVLITQLLIPAIAAGEPARTCPSDELLGEPRLFEAGDGPTHSASGDFNGDRRLDLAYTNFCDHQVAVLLGDGRGGLGPPRHIDVGYLPATIVSGDFNADRKLDLAVANSGDHDVSMLIGDGRGNFTAGSRTYAVGNSPRGLATGDFNEDGRLDLAVANLGVSPFPLGCQNKPDPTHPPVISDPSEHRVAILLGDGQGGFLGPAGNEATFFDAGPNPFRLAAGDLDEDGHFDLAAANGSSETVSILTGDGNGSFDRTQTLSVGFRPIHVAAADLNGDGLLDLAATVNGSNVVSVLLGEEGASFQERKSFAVPSGPRDLDVADLNGDGVVDLAVTHGNFVALMMGKGGGDFGGSNDPDHFADVHVGGNGGAEPVIAGDFDRDRRPDLAIGLAAEDLNGDDHVSIHLNVCRPKKGADR